MSVKRTSVYPHEWVTTVLGGSSSALNGALEFLAAAVLHAFDRNAAEFDENEWVLLNHALEGEKLCDPEDPEPGKYLAALLLERGKGEMRDVHHWLRGLAKKVRGFDHVRCLALQAAVKIQEPEPAGDLWWTKDAFMRRKVGIDF
jgi:hypothetical protein